MTVLFKLKAEDRQQLYYNKFKYKLAIKEINLMFANDAKSINDFYQNMKIAENNKWWRQPVKGAENEDIIQAIIDYRVKYKNDDRVFFRKEGDSLTIFTNEVSIINEVYSFFPTAKLTEVHVMPTGVKLFKREPPAKFRIYMTGGKISKEHKEDLNNYIAKTPDMRPSSGMTKWLKYSYSFISAWSYSSHYIDFDQESNLMMLFILFPGVFSKNYKLEKKD